MGPGWVRRPALLNLMYTWILGFVCLGLLCGANKYISAQTPFCFQKLLTGGRWSLGSWLGQEATDVKPVIIIAL